MANEVATKQTFTQFITSDAVKKNILNVLNDEKRLNKFIPTVINAVTMNNQLQQCDAKTIINAALQGETLNLNSQSGDFYIVPYGNSATFQIGWKGLVQLALRTGQYKYINVGDVREGEDFVMNHLTGVVSRYVRLGDKERKNKKVLGYFAYFQLMSGTEHAIYWDYDTMQDHATTYSQGYRSDIKKGTAFTFWSKNFNDMGYKTVLKQLLSRWGLRSVELLEALASDQSEIQEDGSYKYVDNKESTVKLVTETTGSKPLIVDEDTGEVAEDKLV